MDVESQNFIDKLFKEKEIIRCRRRIQSFSTDSSAVEADDIEGNRCFSEESLFSLSIRLTSYASDNEDSREPSPKSIEFWEEDEEAQLSSESGGFIPTLSPPTSDENTLMAVETPSSIQVAPYNDQVMNESNQDKEVEDCLQQIGDISLEDSPQLYRCEKCSFACLDYASFEKHKKECHDEIY